MVGVTRLLLVVVLVALPLPVSAQYVRRMEAAPPNPPPPVRASRAPAPAPDAVVNINDADLKTLMTLTGVGRSAARRIIAHREAHGRFRRPEDIRTVRGFDERMWQQNRARISIR